MSRYVLSLIIVLVAGGAEARDLQLIYKNNRAVELFKNEKRQEAFDQFLGLTAQDPADVLLKFNMSSSLQALGEEEKAIKLNLVIVKDVNRMIVENLKEGASAEAELQQLSALKFATLYNLGLSYQLLQNNEEALKHYQMALELMPDSKEIKTNIELMFSGGGGGKGKSKDKSKQQQGGEGEGDGDPQEQDEENKDQGQDEKEKQQQQKQQQQQQKNQPKEFDQKHMSKEDLQRIMEELNDQEQKIRAKMERKGGKRAPKDKEW